MKLKDGFVLRQVAGEYVVLPSGDELDLNIMIVLNGTGAFLWERMAEETDKDALVKALLAEYDVDETTAAKSVDAFAAKLHENKLLAD